MYRSRLLAPGPVAVPQAVLEVLARPAVHHRTSAFRETLVRVRERLADLLQVPGDDVLVVGGSGTTAFEAALLAAVPAGSTVVVAHAGKFGERWARMARAFGYTVHEVEAPWGAVLDPDAVAGALRDHPATAALLLTHSETSTGALHDLEAIAGAARAVLPDVLVVVDAVTSAGAVELLPHAWDVDAVVAGSQKGVMLPPGLGYAWLSQRAWARAPQGTRVPSFTLDLHAERPRQRQGDTGATPSVPLVLALEVALDMILAQGMEARWREKALLNEAVLGGAAAVGYAPFAARPSPAVAALLTPDGISAKAVTRAMLARGIRIGGGQDAYAERMIRPSVLGDADAFDALTIVAALEAALVDLGATVAVGEGVAAAQRLLLTV
ncbi:alanine--glyoxylate aminotransferase family protein [soil metagenome]